MNISLGRLTAHDQIMDHAVTLRDLITTSLPLIHAAQRNYQSVNISLERLTAHDQVMDHAVTLRGLITTRLQLVFF